MGRTALVTGASGGIGYALAAVFAENKFDLVIIARSTEKLEDIRREFETRHGIKVDVITADLMDPVAPSLIAWEITARGVTIDVLVNNAGFGTWGPFEASDWQAQAGMLQVNIVALTQLTRLLLPGMLYRGRGSILNVASTAAFAPGPLMSVYFASKAYVHSFSAALAREVAGRGVTVTCLCPGPTASGFQQRAANTHIRVNKGRRLAPARLVAEYGYRAMVQGQAVAIYGLDNRLVVFLTRFLPTSLVARCVQFLQAAST